MTRIASQLGVLLMVAGMFGAQEIGDLVDRATRAHRHHGDAGRPALRPALDGIRG
jgi:hypothetical protein